MTCRQCHEQADFQGVFSWDRKKPVTGPGDLRVRSSLVYKPCNRLQTTSCSVGQQSAGHGISCSPNFLHIVAFSGFRRTPLRYAYVQIVD